MMLAFFPLLIAALSLAASANAQQTAFSRALDLFSDSNCTTTPLTALPYEFEYPALLPTDSCGATVGTDDDDAVFHFTELTADAVAWSVSDRRCRVGVDPASWGNEVTSSSGTINGQCVATTGDDEIPFAKMSCSPASDTAVYQQKHLLQRERLQRW